MELSGLLPRIHRSAPRESELTGARYPLLRLSPPPLYTVIGYPGPERTAKLRISSQKRHFRSQPRAESHPKVWTHTDSHGLTRTNMDPGPARGRGPVEPAVLVDVKHRQAIVGPVPLPVISIFIVYGCATRLMVRCLENSNPGCFPVRVGPCLSVWVQVRGFRPSRLPSSLSAGEPNGSCFAASGTGPFKGGRGRPRGGKGLPRPITVTGL